MRVVGASHGHGVALVLQAVVGLVVDRGIGALLAHARLHTAALDHETVDHTMEQRVVVVTLLHISQKVSYGFRGLLGVEF